RGEVAEPHRVVGVLHDTIEVYPTMGDARCMQEHELVPEGCELVGIEGGRPVEQRCAVRPHRDQGVAVVTQPGSDDVRYPGAGSLCEEGDEPLVFDILDAAEPSGSLGAAVPDATPCTGEQLTVPGVAPIHLHLHRAHRIPPGEQHRAFPSHRDRVEPVDLEAEVLERAANPPDRREPARRSEHQVERSACQETQGDRGDGTGGKGCPRHNAPRSWTMMSQRPTRRNGTVSRGASVARTALVMASIAGGNTGGRPTAAIRENSAAGGPPP